MTLTFDLDLTLTLSLTFDLDDLMKYMFWSHVTYKCDVVRYIGYQAPDRNFYKEHFPTN